MVESKGKTTKYVIFAIVISVVVQLNRKQNKVIRLKFGCSDNNMLLKTFPILLINKKMISSYVL